MRNRMSKLDAIFALIRVGRYERVTNADAKRAVRALRSLDCTDDEIRQAMTVLEFRNGETGEPWSPKIEKSWP